MKVMMTGFARKQIRKTAKYINKRFGKKSKDMFLLSVQQMTLYLENNPYLGPKEPLLANETSEYRSVVLNHLNKMVYRIMVDYIEVADFWDCRRDPKEQASKTIAHSADSQENDD